MELAVYMRNKRTGEERVKRIAGLDASPGNWECSDFYHGSDWEWISTVPLLDVIRDIKHIEGSYYMRKVQRCL